MSFQSIAAVPGNSQPQLVDPIEPSKVSAGEVICETVFLGVCGTDREILHAGTPHVPPGDEQLVLGHECLAQVLEVGHAKTGRARLDGVAKAIAQYLDVAI